eukprot:665906-Pelagomonas_calceolata.AAC.1
MQPSSLLRSFILVLFSMLKNLLAPRALERTPWSPFKTPRSPFNSHYQDQARVTASNLTLNPPDLHRLLSFPLGGKDTRCFSPRYPLILY